MDSISPIDCVICGLYLALVIGLGLFFSNKQKDNDDFFLGGRNMHWLPVELSLFASTFSSKSFVGLPAEGAFGDYHQLLAIFFIPFYKGLGFISLYEYLERRFSRPIRLMASLIFMLYLAGWMGTMLLAVSRIIEVVLDTTSIVQTLSVIVVVGLLMIDILGAVASTPMVLVTRIPWNDMVLFKRALDAGVQTIMFPFVQTIEEAEAVVRATRYPPDGVRGVTATNRGHRHSIAGGHSVEANEHIGVIVQLETPEAIAKMPEIAAVPGVDVLLIGLGDLAASMGRIGEIGHPEVQAALKAGAEQARFFSKPVGIDGERLPMTMASAMSPSSRTLPCCLPRRAKTWAP